MTSIAQQIGQAAETADRRAAKGDFFKVCRLMMKHRSAFAASKYAAEERATERVQRILQKTAVTGGDLTAWSAVADYVNVQQAFQESLGRVLINRRH